MIQTYSKEIRAVGIIFLLKLLILFLLPLTGDEAYFITWAHYPMAGYYDHPPMVGWIIYLMSFISHHYLVYRLFAVATVVIVAYVIFRIAQLHVNKEHALLAALAFLASPIDLLVVMMTNDIPLLLFGSLGTLFLLYALERDTWLRYALLSGLFLGLALLSKYFAVFLMLGLLLFALSTYRGKALKIIAVITVVIALFGAQNLYFNYHNCWNNILFNFISRTTQSHFQLKSVLGYLAILLYLITPWGLYYLFQARATLTHSNIIKLCGAVLAVALGIFLIVSLKKSVGLHWLLLFVPYFFLLFSLLPREQLQTIIRFNARFTYLHAIVLIVVLLIPISLFQGHKKYADALLFTQPEAICHAIDEHNITRLFAYGYSTAALLSYHCERDVHMLYNTNKYGRLDDKLVDVRALADQNFSLLDKRAFNADDIALFESTCNQAIIDELQVNGASYHLITCNGFKYNAYKRQILDTLKQKYYTLPSWLPYESCYFLQRYYP